MNAPLTAETILTSLTRTIDPGFGINVVDLGCVYGVEVNGRDVTITLAWPHEQADQQATLRRAIETSLRMRHPELAAMTIVASNDPPWRDDFITDEGRLQLEHPIIAGSVEDHVDAAAVMESLRLVLDPEVGVNIVDLGLVYGADVTGDRVTVTMTLTTPGCPLHASIEAAVQRVIETRHPAIRESVVDLVWEPAWSTDMITDAGRKEMGW